jgi:hypothetical protein
MDAVENRTVDLIREEVAAIPDLDRSPWGAAPREMKEHY